jgi:hypothetical protein
VAVADQRPDAEPVEQRERPVGDGLDVGVGVELAAVDAGLDLIGEPVVQPALELLGNGTELRVTDSTEPQLDP